MQTSQFKYYSKVAIPTMALFVGYCCNDFADTNHYPQNKIQNHVFYVDDTNTNVSGVYTSFSSAYGVINVNNDIQRNLEKLNAILKLEENWNGYNAVTFSQEFIESIKQCILKLKRQPEIFPIAYGNIQLEYDRRDGGYLEFEISSQSEIKCYYESGQGDSKEFLISDFDELNQEVTRFYGI